MYIKHKGVINIIKRKLSGPIGGDCAAIYSIKLCRDYTLKEFIEEILKECPKEWGFFELREELRARPFKVIEYKNGNLAGEIPTDIADVRIRCTKSNGGWRNMDYVIIIGGIN